MAVNMGADIAIIDDPFLSCLHGSERFLNAFVLDLVFLSCLRGSEQLME